MSRGTKIAFAIIGGLVVLCVVVVVAAIIVVRTMGPSIAENVMINDPTKVAEAASKIAEYDLPDGYKEQTLMNMGMEKMLFISPEKRSDRSSQPMITLLQLSSFVTNSQTDRERFRQQMQQSLGQTGRNQASLELIDEKEVEIDGQDVNLLIYEGETGYGVQIRQVISDLFEIKDAQVMLMIMGPVDGWPEDEIDTFITSIH